MESEVCVTQCFLLSQIPQDTVLEIWKGKNYKTELSRMTSAGHRVLLSAPWYINHISTGQDWRDSYAVQPQNFSGVWSSMSDWTQAAFIACSCCITLKYSI